MSGQFGMNKPASNVESTNSAATSAATSSATEALTAPALHISEAPLDADLRTSLDKLPRRVNDQFQNLGDMVNFIIVARSKTYKRRSQLPTGMSPIPITGGQCSML